MKIIKPSFELLDAVDGAAVLRKIEQCGRTCYKSEDRITPDSAAKFVRDVIQRGHESVIEHVSITGKFVCDRGVSHEIVRHRIASYSQSSTRYCNYSQDKFGNEITVIAPCYWEEGSLLYETWKTSCEYAEAAYLRLTSGIRDDFKLLLDRECVKYKATPEQARAVLPNSLKTELVMTANLREWRHFFRLRCSERAHPQMREVAVLGLKVMHDAVPVVFDDLWEVYGNEN